MRRAVPLTLLIVILLVGAAYFLVTARFVGRHLLHDLPEPNAFAGPEVLNGYILSRGMRGPESFIEDPAGAVVIPVPPESIARVGVARIAAAGVFILGEVASIDSGESLGYFLIDTARGVVHPPMPEQEWRRLVGEQVGGTFPELHPADSFTGAPMTP